MEDIPNVEVWFPASGWVLSVREIQFGLIVSCQGLRLGEGNNDLYDSSLYCPRDVSRQELVLHVKFVIIQTVLEAS